MSARRAHRVGVAVVAAVVAVAGVACGGDREPLRVGVLVECDSIFASTRPGALAGAALPLVERGAKPGAEPGEIEGARVAGRAIEILPACSQVTRFARLIAETRWLVESEGADVVVGPLGAPEGAMMRRVAAKYPDVTFLVGTGGAQETTLRDPQRNLFRFTPDGAQSVAGLATYAFENLGWRRAVVVAEGYPGGWEATAGFVAEFCSLGGSIVERDFESLLFTPDPVAAATRHAASADGVALFATAAPPVPYLARYAAAVGEGLGTRLVVAGPPFFDQSSLAPMNVDLTGVVLGGYVPLDPDDRSMRAYLASLNHAYPTLQPGAAYHDPTYASYTAVEALASALEATDGEIGAGQAELRGALSGLELELPQGAVRLDGNRQAIGEISLERIVRKASGRAELEGFATVQDVDQRFGGLFTPETPPPSPSTPACVKGSPPAWAR